MLNREMYLFVIKKFA